MAHNDDSDNGSSNATHPPTSEPPRLSAPPLLWLCLVCDYETPFEGLAREHQEREQHSVASTAHRHEPGCYVGSVLACRAKLRAELSGRGSPAQPTLRAPRRGGHLLVVDGAQVPPLVERVAAMGALARASGAVTHLCAADPLCMAEVAGPTDVCPRHRPASRTEQSAEASAPRVGWWCETCRESFPDDTAALAHAASSGHTLSDSAGPAEADPMQRLSGLLVRASAAQMEALTALRMAAQLMGGMTKPLVLPEDLAELASSEWRLRREGQRMLVYALRRVERDQARERIEAADWTWLDFQGHRRGWGATIDRTPAEVCTLWARTPRELAAKVEAHSLTAKRPAELVDATGPAFTFEAVSECPECHAVTYELVDGVPQLAHFDYCSKAGAHEGVRS